MKKIRIHRLNFGNEKRHAFRVQVVHNIGLDRLSLVLASQLDHARLVRLRHQIIFHFSDGKNFDEQRQSLIVFELCRERATARENFVFGQHKRKC